MAVIHISAADKAGVVNGMPVLLGKIVATTTINNHDTATPFNNTGDALKTKVLLIQADAACHIAFGTTNAVTATTANLKLSADSIYTFVMGPDYGWLAIVSVSGTTNVKVCELL